MNEPIRIETSWLLLAPCREVAPTRYTLATVAELAGLHPELLRHYSRLGLFGAVRSDGDGEPVFDDDSLREVRRFEECRRHYRLRRRALRLVWDLWREVERLREETKALRGA